jgi:hypothetical protein
MSNAVKNEIAPPTYSVLHAHRSPTAHHPHGGGLAIIHKNTMIVKHHQFDPGLNLATFEVQIVRVVSSRPPIMIVNVYRPPSTSVADFLTELHDFLASLISSVTDRLLLCGDLNCPGVDDSTVNSDLAVALQELGWTQHVCRPTRKNHLLDIIATDDALSVSEKDVDDAGCISDHRLVVVSINYQSTVKKPAVKNYWRIRNINLLEFEAKSSCVPRHCLRLRPLPPKRSQNSWRRSSYQHSMSLRHCANSNVGCQGTLHGGCRWQPLALNVHAGVSSGDGAVISKRQTGLRIVVRAVLLVNSFRSLVVTIFSKNCHLLQTPNSDGLSRNTCCTLQTRLLISTTLNPVGYAVIFRTLTRLCRLSKQSLRLLPRSLLLLSQILPTLGHSSLLFLPLPLLKWPIY